jgi:hypothetical protein
MSVLFTWGNIDNLTSLRVYFYGLRTERERTWHEVV